MPAMNPFSLRSKILFILVFVFVLLGVAAYFIHSKILLPEFAKLERQHIRDNLLRVTHALENEQQHLAMLTNDWSAWDDTYRYIVDHNADYESSNLVDATFEINQIHLIFFLDRAGKKVWGKAFAEDFNTPLSLESFSRGQFPPGFPLLQYGSEEVPLNEQQSTGVLMTSAGPMLCSARPILDSNDQGPARGTLIMGRLLGQSVSQKISRLTNVSFDIRRFTPNVSRVETPGQIHYQTKGHDLLASTAIGDLSGRPVLEITVYEKREILNQGLQALRVALTLSVIGYAILLCLMMVMLQRSVVTPLQQLTHNILSRLRSKGSPVSLDTGTCTSSEICQVVDVFKQLLGRLDTKNNQLAEVNFDLIEEAKKLREAEKSLKKLDQLKSEFISTAAHELRTPLASIMGYTELLASPEMREPFSEAQRQEFLAEIYESSEALTKIVDDILDISRIEAGRGIPMNKQPTSIAPLLEKVLKRFRLKVSQELSLEVQDGVPEALEIDSNRIVQVMENLLSNAIKYSPKESCVQVVAELEGNHCKITVSDHGIGMTPDEAVHIFDKFYRADASNTAIRGLGLGMSIVKQIVEEHQGVIWVDSSPGEGTRVYFTLPVNPSE